MKKDKLTADWLVGVSVDDALETIGQTFTFLVDDFSFQEPIDCSINSMVVALRYSAFNIAIQPVVDRKDGFVYTNIIRLVEGQCPAGWQIDQQGNQFMVRLFEATQFKASWDRGNEWQYRFEPEISPNGYLQVLLEAEAKTLRDAFPEFLADDPSFFDQLNAKRSADAAAEAERDFFAVADKYFSSKDYSHLVRHLENSKYPLNVLWQKRLNYARKSI